MSYILDALKRSSAEREREQGQVPGLQSQPLAVPPAPGSGTRAAVWPWVVAGVGAAALGATVWLWPASTPDVPARAALPAAPAQAQAYPAPPEAPAAPAHTPPVIMPMPLPATPSVSAPVSSQPALAKARPTPAPTVAPSSASSSTSSSATKPTPAEPRVLALAELPDAVRAGLPKLQVQGAVYADKPSDRLLILNGQPLREGDAVAPSLTLEKIFPQSATLNMSGMRFTLSF